MFDRLKYRWEFCEDIFPDGSETKVIAWTLPDDKEPIMILRRLRAVLFGYGPGWTFGGALISFFIGL